MFVFFVAACFCRMAFLCGFVLVPARRHDGGVDAFHEVHVDHVGFDELASRFDAVALVLHGLRGPMILLPDSLRHVSTHLLDHVFSRTVGKGFIGHGDDGFGWFVLDAGVGGAFAGPVETNESLEEVLIGEFLRLRPFGANLDGFPGPSWSD